MFTMTKPNYLNNGEADDDVLICEDDVEIITISDGDDDEVVAIENNQNTNKKTDKTRHESSDTSSSSSSSSDDSSSSSDSSDSSSSSSDGSSESSSDSEDEDQRESRADKNKSDEMFELISSDEELIRDSTSNSKEGFGELLLEDITSDDEFETNTQKIQEKNLEQILTHNNSIDKNDEILVQNNEKIIESEQENIEKDVFEQSPNVDNILDQNKKEIAGKELEKEELCENLDLDNIVDQKEKELEREEVNQNLDFDNSGAQIVDMSSSNTIEYTKTVEKQFENKHSEETSINSHISTEINRDGIVEKLDEREAVQSDVNELLDKNEKNMELDLEKKKSSIGIKQITTENVTEVNELQTDINCQSLNTINEESVEHELSHQNLDKTINDEEITEKEIPKQTHNCNLSEKLPTNIIFKDISEGLDNENLEDCLEDISKIDSDNNNGNLEDNLVKKVVIKESKSQNEDDINQVQKEIPERKISKEITNNNCSLSEKIPENIIPELDREADSDKSNEKVDDDNAEKVITKNSDSQENDDFNNQMEKEISKKEASKQITYDNCSVPEKIPDNIIPELDKEADSDNNEKIEDELAEKVITENSDSRNIDDFNNQMEKEAPEKEASKQITYDNYSVPEKIPENVIPELDREADSDNEKIEDDLPEKVDTDNSESQGSDDDSSQGEQSMDEEEEEEESNDQQFNNQETDEDDDSDDQSENSEEKLTKEELDKRIREQLEKFKNRTVQCLFTSSNSSTTATNNYNIKSSLIEKFGAKRNSIQQNEENSTSQITNTESSNLTVETQEIISELAIEVKNVEEKENTIENVNEKQLENHRVIECCNTLSEGTNDGDEADETNQKEKEISNNNSNEEKLQNGIDIEFCEVPSLPIIEKLDEEYVETTTVDNNENLTLIDKNQSDSEDDCILIEENSKEVKPKTDNVEVLKVQGFTVYDGVDDFEMSDSNIDLSKISQSILDNYKPMKMSEFEEEEDDDYEKYVENSDAENSNITEQNPEIPVTTDENINEKREEEKEEEEVKNLPTDLNNVRLTYVDTLLQKLATKSSTEDEDKSQINCTDERSTETTNHANNSVKSMKIVDKLMSKIGLCIPSSINEGSFKRPDSLITTKPTEIKDNCDNISTNYKAKTTTTTTTTTRTTDADVTTSSSSSLVPSKIHSRDCRSSIFVSEELDNFLKENDLENSANIDLPKHQNFDDGLVFDYRTPPPKIRSIALHFDQQTELNENPPRYRTVAEKRQLLEKNDYKLNMNEQQKNLHFDLRKRMKNSVIDNERLESILNQSKIPMTRDYWKIAIWLHTQLNRFYYQQIEIDGYAYKLCGSKGNHTDKYLMRSIQSKLSSNEYEKISQICSKKCKDQHDELLSKYGNIKINFNVEDNKESCKEKEYETESNRSVQNIVNTKENYIKIKSGPASSKCFQRSCDPNLGPTQLYKMPEVKLIVYPKINRPLSNNVKPYLKLISQTGNITREWAEFATSTLITCTPNDKEQESSKEFEFLIPYCNDQNKILVRRIYNKKEILDPSEFYDYKYEFQEKIKNNNVDQITTECSNILAEMINCVALSMGSDSLIQDDSDANYNNNDEKPKFIVDDVLNNGTKRKIHSSKNYLLNSPEKNESSNRKNIKPKEDHDNRKLIMELKRLNATVVNIGNANESEHQIHQLREKMTENLAPVEKNFTATLVLAGDNSYVVNDQISLCKRGRRKPKKYGINDDVQDEEETFVQYFPTNNNQKVDGLKSKETQIQEQKKSQDSYICGRSLKDFQHLSVDLIKLDLKEIEPFCLIHNLYKCWCYNETDNENVKSDNGPNNLKEIKPMKKIKSFESHKITQKSNKFVSPKSNKIVAPKSNKIAAPKSNKVEPPKSNKVEPPKSNKVEPPKSNKVESPKSKAYETRKRKYQYKYADDESDGDDSKDEDYSVHDDNASVSQIMPRKRPLIVNSTEKNTSNSISFIFSKYTLSKQKFKMEKTTDCSRTKEIPSDMFTLKNKIVASEIKKKIQTEENAATQMLLLDIIKSSEYYNNPYLKNNSVDNNQQQNKQAPLKKKPKSNLSNPSEVQNTAGVFLPLSSSSVLSPNIKLTSMNTNKKNSRTASTSLTSSANSNPFVSSLPSALSQQTSNLNQNILMNITKILNTNIVANLISRKLVNDLKIILQNKLKLNLNEIQSFIRKIYEKSHLFITYCTRNVCLAQLKQHHKLPQTASKGYLNLWNWRSILNAYKTRNIFIWEIQTSLNNKFYVATNSFQMPAISNAISVRNLKTIQQHELNLFGKMIRNQIKNEQTNMLMILFTDYGSYWKILGMIHSQNNYFLNDYDLNSVKNDKLTKSIDMFFKMLVEHEVRKIFAQKQQQHNQNCDQEVNTQQQIQLQDHQQQQHQQIQLQDHQQQQHQQIQLQDQQQHQQIQLHNQEQQHQQIQLQDQGQQHQQIHLQDQQKSHPLEQLQEQPQQIQLREEEQQQTYIVQEIHHQQEIQQLNNPQLQQELEVVNEHNNTMQNEQLQIVYEAGEINVNNFVRSRSNVLIHTATQFDINLFKMISLPELQFQNVYCWRWFVLRINQDFTHLVMSTIHDKISMVDIMKRIHHARKLQVNIKICEKSDPRLFVSPVNVNYLIYGPLKFNEDPPVVNLYHKNRKVFMTRESYNRVHGISSDTDFTYAFFVVTRVKKIKKTNIFEETVNAVASILPQCESASVTSLAQTTSSLSSQVKVNEQSKQLSTSVDNVADNNYESSDDDDCTIIEDAELPPAKIFDEQSIPSIKIPKPILNKNQINPTAASCKITVAQNHKINMIPTAVNCQRRYSIAQEDISASLSRRKSTATNIGIHYANTDSSTTSSLTNKKLENDKTNFFIVSPTTSSLSHYAVINDIQSVKSTDNSSRIISQQEDSLSKSPNTTDTIAELSKSLTLKNITLSRVTTPNSLTSSSIVKTTTTTTTPLAVKASNNLKDSSPHKRSAETLTTIQPFLKRQRLNSLNVAEKSNSSFEIPSKVLIKSPVLVTSVNNTITSQRESITKANAKNVVIQSPITSTAVKVTPSTSSVVTTVPVPVSLIKTSVFAPVSLKTIPSTITSTISNTKVVSSPTKSCILTVNPITKQITIVRPTETTQKSQIVENKTNESKNVHIQSVEVIKPIKVSPSTITSTPLKTNLSENFFTKSTSSAITHPSVTSTKNNLPAIKQSVTTTPSTSMNLLTSSLPQKNQRPFIAGHLKSIDEWPKFPTKIYNDRVVIRYENNCKTFFEMENIESLMTRFALKYIKLPEKYNKVSVIKWRFFHMDKDIKHYVDIIPFTYENIIELRQVYLSSSELVETGPNSTTANNINMPTKTLTVTATKNAKPINTLFTQSLYSKSPVLQPKKFVLQSNKAPPSSSRTVASYITLDDDDDDN